LITQLCPFRGKGVGSGFPNKRNKPNKSLQSLSTIVTENSKSIEALSALPTMIKEQADTIKVLTNAVQSLTESAFAEGNDYEDENLTPSDPVNELLGSINGERSVNCNKAFYVYTRSVYN